MTIRIVTCGSAKDVANAVIDCSITCTACPGVVVRCSISIITLTDSCSSLFDCLQKVHKHAPQGNGTVNSVVVQLPLCVRHASPQHSIVQQCLMSADNWQCIASV